MLKSYSPEVTNTDEITIISNGVKIEGKINSSGNIRVDGEVQGDIISQSNVTVGQSGKVNGKIEAKVITVGGSVLGTASAKEKLVLESKSIFTGDLFTKILVVEDGAKFDGNSKMSGQKNNLEIKENIAVNNKGSQEFLNK
ncbi:MAG TPA: cell shape determination protein CcmA [Ignavibacteriales bacterium]|nr:cell shape determination protein CcmA [Ignavibacteriales bacterium]